jgi:hypothetical protein
MLSELVFAISQFGSSHHKDLNEIDNLIKVPIKEEYSFIF